MKVFFSITIFLVIIVLVDKSLSLVVTLGTAVVVVFVVGWVLIGIVGRVGYLVIDSGLGRFLVLDRVAMGVVAVGGLRVVCAVRGSSCGLVLEPEGITRNDKFMLYLQGE